MANAEEALLASEDFYCSLGNTVVDLRIAKLVHNPRFKLVHAANHVRAVHLPKDADAKEFVLDAEEMLQDRGVRHSIFHLDRRTVPESFRLILVDLGYAVYPKIGLFLEGQPTGCLNRYVHLVHARGGVWREQFLHLLQSRRLPEPVRSQTLRVRQSKYAHPSVHTFVAYCGSEVAGVLSLSSFNGLGTIRDLYVAPGFRSQGVAAEMIGQMMRLSRRAGVRAFGAFLHPDNVMNRIYKKLGFRELTTISWFVLRDSGNAEV